MRATEQRLTDWRYLDALFADRPTLPSALERLTDEHVDGEHRRAAHPDCPACRVAAQMRRGEFR